MQFLYPALSWGLLLVAVPLIIHLINLVRQKRVEWAAMEFLLQAYRKQRRWIWLRQFLLLLLRMLAVALIVLMLAHLVTNRQWLQFVGSSTTHHLVLLDDSYSMSDRDVSSVFEHALDATRFLIESAQRQPTPQRLTLIRFSEVGADRASRHSESLVDTQADISGRSLGNDFVSEFTERTATWQPTQESLGPEPALAAATSWVQAHADEQCYVYVMSDFRSANWAQTAETRTLLAELEAAGASVQLVRCVDEAHANLSLTALRPAAGTRAAGVPLFFDVTVSNQGSQSAQSVTVSLSGDTYDDGESLTTGPTILRQPLPALVVPELAPGAKVTKRFQGYFAVPGQHVVRAQLEPDAVAADNQRACVIDFPDGIPVLVVDGDASQRNARYIRTVFQPGERVQTGLRCTVRDGAWLRDASPDELTAFAAVYLLDVARVEERTQRMLSDYVREGGGLAVFLGPQINLPSYVAWHRSTPDIFPILLDRPEQLGPSLESLPDLIVDDHPLFRALQGDGNPLLRSIQIRQFVRGSVPAMSAEEANTQVIARLRSGHPLIVDHRAGAGRVVVFLTTLAPTWNNWATQPTFVVLLLELQSYLCTQPSGDEAQLVGAAWSDVWPADQFRDTARVSFQPLAESPSAAADAAPTPGGERETQQRDLRLQTATLPDGRAGWKIPTQGLRGQTNLLRDAAGVATLRLERQDGTPKIERLAINVDPAEGRLSLVSENQLRTSLANTGVRVIRFGDLQSQTVEAATFSWNETLLAVLLTALIVEQLLAYQASYHPTTRRP